jgi:hypothetical protein
MLEPPQERLFIGPAAGTSPPRVMQTIASNGPTSLSRQERAGRRPQSISCPRRSKSTLGAPRCSATIRYSRGANWFRRNWPRRVESGLCAHGIGTSALPSWDPRMGWSNLIGGLAGSDRQVQANMRTHLIHRPELAQPKPLTPSGQHAADLLDQGCSSGMRAPQDQSSPRRGRISRNF